MNLYKTKNNGYFLDRYPVEIKGKKLSFFIRGEGYKKDSFEITDIEMPELHDKSLTWFDIAKIGYQYGIHVAEVYADARVSGIIARQTAYGYMKMYSKIKDIINEDTFHKPFFDLLRCDYMLSYFGMYTLDIIRLDETLGKLDPEYDNINCLYRGEKCSMAEYIEVKMGLEYRKVIDALCK